ncbi:hypothetical protein ACHAW5_010715 [Stephanodiscus triporus]|uniref:Uncharacterized protein n=1 Tax=Stephanodiscus triporus TaxID=2934178 RepID=A0ABD3MLM4_9STRA
MAYNQARVAATAGGVLAPAMNDAVLQQAEARAFMAALAGGDGAMHAHAQAAVRGAGGGNGGDGDNSDDDDGDSTGYGNGAPQRDEREQDGTNDAGNRNNARDDYDDAGRRGQWQ